MHCSAFTFFNINFMNIKHCGVAGVPANGHWEDKNVIPEVYKSGESSVSEVLVLQNCDGIYYFHRKPDPISKILSSFSMISVNEWWSLQQRSTTKSPNPINYATIVLVYSSSRMEFFHPSTWTGRSRSLACQMWVSEESSCQGLNPESTRSFTL